MKNFFSSNVVGKIFFSLFFPQAFYYICAACNVFLPTSACGKFFFQNHPPPPPSPSRVKWSAPNRSERQARAVRARLDYQPLFGKMSPHSKDRTRETAEIEPTYVLVFCERCCCFGMSIYSIFPSWTYPQTRRRFCNIERSVFFPNAGIWAG